jgi:hypothetical protein
MLIDGMGAWRWLSSGIKPLFRWVIVLYLAGCAYPSQVFQDYEDDQYDFHSYCMRRMTLSAYMA